MELSKIKRKDLSYNGIYVIKNLINNKIYIGSSASKAFLYERLIHHKRDLITNNHYNSHLQNSFNKYGIDKFIIIILEKCEPVNCLSIEQHYINNLKPEYNKELIAGNSLGRIISKETSKKISESNKKWWAVTENKLKMIEKFSQREGTLPIEKRYKVKQPTRKVIDLNTGIIYKNVKELSKGMNRNYTYLISILGGNRNSKRINIRYVE